MRRLKRMPKKNKLFCPPAVMQGDDFFVDKWVNTYLVQLQSEKTRKNHSICLYIQEKREENKYALYGDI